MAPHNAKIQFDYVEKWLKCETRYFEKQQNWIPCKKKSLEIKFFGNNFPWKRHSLQKNSLEIKFLVKKFLGMTFLGKRFPCYVVSPFEKYRDLYGFGKPNTKIYLQIIQRIGNSRYVLIDWWQKINFNKSNQISWSRSVA